MEGKMLNFMLNPGIPRKIKNDDLVISRREQIALAGIKLFSKKGFHETTLRELAEEAGLGLGNIYDYVGNKQDIFFLIHGFLNGRATEMTDQAIKDIDDDPLERLYRMIGAEIELMNEYSDAVLLIYRESHILDKLRLKELLANEKARVMRLEQVLKECVAKKLLHVVNIRAAANFIKTMVETLVIKRWDLRRFVSQSDLKRTLVNIIFNGILENGISDRQPIETSEIDDLRGKSALIINASGIWGKELSSFLLSKGVKLALHISNDPNNESSEVTSQLKEWKQAEVHLSKHEGPMTLKLLKKILLDFGPIEFIIHDLGGSVNSAMLSKGKEKQSAPLGFQENLNYAQELVDYVQGSMNKMGLKRILYLAPWAWDRHINPIWHETTKAAIMNLTRIMSKSLAASHINVNCVVPGFIEKTKSSKLEEGKYLKVINDIPLGFIGETRDVLESIYFLISDRSRYLTGEVLSVSGGSK
jgi:AcrR family transcriptional regulator